jgi:hypothetical protein
MKRIGYLYEKIYDINNIKEAIRKSSKGKRDRKHVLKILNNIDYYSLKIQKMLIDKTYIPSPYTIKKIVDGSSNKIREIYKPRYYPDQIIHWALILQTEKVFMKGMYAYTCGSVKGRGSGLGKKIIRKWLDNDYRGTKYCFKMDISKYYPSIDKFILKQMLRKHIKDKDCLWLFDVIIDSNENGLPIGNYTSQWLSNFFLQDLDHYIKEQLKVKYYIRYVDDICILGSNKRKLHKIYKNIEEFLIKINLKIKGDWQIYPTDKRAIDFLGYRFFRDKTILRGRNSLRIRRRVNKINKKDYLNIRDAQAIISYWGWIKSSNSYNFYKKYVKSKISIGKAKRIVSKYARQTNNLC